MSRAAITIAMLLHGAQAADAAEWKRMEARCAWVKERTAAWHEAMLAMDERCMEAVERMDEEEFERFFDAEQAKVDAIRAELQAVIDKDEWPKDLYWGDV